MGLPMGKTNTLPTETLLQPIIFIFKSRKSIHLEISEKIFKKTNLIYLLIQLHQLAEYYPVLT